MTVKVTMMVNDATIALTVTIMIMLIEMFLPVSYLGIPNLEK